MRRFVVLCAFAAAMSATTASAGLIYGIVRLDGKPVGKDHTVSVTPPSGGEPRVAKTDKNGTYRVNVPQEGRCMISVKHNERTSNSIPVYSYGNPVRCNLVLEEVNDELKLRRK